MILSNDSTNHNSVSHSKHEGMNDHTDHNSLSTLQKHTISDNDQADASSVAQLNIREAQTDLVSQADSDRVDQRIELKTMEHVLKFDKDEFTVKAGTIVEIHFENIDFMPHNLLVIKPGSLERVGVAADAMMSDPDAFEKNYVPELSDVLFNTPVLEIEETFTLRFKVPAEPGDYPYVCTFPGHWRVMNGIMRVAK
jgi:azurin